MQERNVKIKNKTQTRAKKIQNKHKQTKNEKPNDGYSSVFHGCMYVHGFVLMRIDVSRRRFLCILKVCEYTYFVNHEPFFSRCRNTQHSYTQGICLCCIEYLHDGHVFFSSFLSYTQTNMGKTIKRTSSSKSLPDEAYPFSKLHQPKSTKRHKITKRVTFTDPVHIPSQEDLFFPEHIGQEQMASLCGQQCNCQAEKNETYNLQYHQENVTLVDPSESAYVFSEYHKDGGCDEMDCTTPGQETNNETTTQESIPLVQQVYSEIQPPLSQEVYMTCCENMYLLCDNMFDTLRELSTTPSYTTQPLTQEGISAPISEPNTSDTQPFNEGVVRPVCEFKYPNPKPKSASSHNNKAKRSSSTPSKQKQKQKHQQQFETIHGQQDVQAMITMNSNGGIPDIMVANPNLVYDTPALCNQRVINEITFAAQEVDRVLQQSIEMLKVMIEKLPYITNQSSGSKSEI